MAKKYSDYREEDDDIEDDFPIESDEEDDDDRPLRRAPKKAKKQKRAVVDDEDDIDDDDEDDEDDDRPAKRAPKKAKKRRFADDEDDEDDIDDDDDDEDDEDDDRPAKRAPKKAKKRRIDDEDDDFDDSDDEDDEDDDTDDDEDDEEGSSRAVPSPIRRAPVKKEEESLDNSAKKAIAREKDFSVSLTKMILLSIVTLGIYLFVRIYAITKYLNNLKGAKGRSPGGAVALSIFFMPFYFPFWLCESARRVDEMCRERKVSSNLTTLSVFLVFIPLWILVGTGILFLLSFLSSQSVLITAATGMLILYFGISIAASLMLIFINPPLLVCLQNKINIVIDCNVKTIIENSYEELKKQKEEEENESEKLIQEASRTAKEGDEQSKTAALLRYKEMLERRKITPEEYAAIERAFHLK